MARTPTSTPLLTNSSLAAASSASTLRCASARGIACLLAKWDTVPYSPPLVGRCSVYFSLRRPKQRQPGGTMQYRTFGKTGIKVSPYALGAMMFGAVGNPDHEDSVRIIHKALEAGINFIDTADAYSHGESEEIVGKAIPGRRDSIVLATKFGLPMDPDDPNQRGASRRWIMRAVEDSLRRLGTDYIDLDQKYVFDPSAGLGGAIS